MALGETSSQFRGKKQKNTILRPPPPKPDKKISGKIPEIFYVMLFDQTMHLEGHTLWQVPQPVHLS